MIAAAAWLLFGLVLAGPVNANPVEPVESSGPKASATADSSAAADSTADATQSARPATRSGGGQSNALLPHWRAPVLVIAVVAVAVLLTIVQVVLARRRKSSDQIDSKTTGTDTARIDERIRGLEAQESANSAIRAFRTSDPARSPQSGTAPAGKIPAGKTVLMADDNPTVTRALAIRLEALGVTSLRSPDAAHALFGAHRINPDLIILDMEMPSGSGLAVCEMLLADPSRAHIPIIIYTGSSNSETVKRCKELGVHYVQKGENHWHELEPLIGELLGATASDNSDSVPDVEPTPQCEVMSEPVQPAPPPAVASHEKNIVEEQVRDEPASSNADADDGPDASVLDAPLKLLCITRAPKVFASIQKNLQPEGVVVTTAEDVETAYLACFSHKPDAIVVDATLSGSDPYAAMKRFREHPMAGHAPAVVLVKDQEAVLEKKMAALGDVTCIAQPIDFNSLMSSFRQYSH